MPKKTPEEIRIAEKIKSLRQKQKLTLKELSNRTGLSPALLSQIENNLVSPPIATLLKIAKALQVKLSYFFEDEEEKDEKSYIYTSVKNRETIYREGTEYGYSYQLLAPGKPDKNMEPFYVKFTSSKMGRTQFFKHEGEEFLYLLKGELLYTIGKEVIKMKPGDSIYFDSSVPHSVRCISKECAEAIVVVYTPSS